MVDDMARFDELLLNLMRAQNSKPHETAEHHRALEAHVQQIVDERDRHKAKSRVRLVELRRINRSVALYSALWQEAMSREMLQAEIARDGGKR